MRIKEPLAVFRFVLIASSLGFSSSLLAQTRMSFLQFVEAAQKNGGSLEQEQARVDFAKARVEFAQSKAWFSGNLTALTAPVPGATGNAISGRTNWDKWGILTGMQLEIFQPIYSFGAISSGKNAAQAGLRAEQALLENERLKLISDVAELYYGYQMAFEYVQLTSEADEQLTKALEKLKSPAQRDQLATVVNEIKIRLQEAEFGRLNAKRAMAWKIGTPDVEPQWDRANLVPRAIELKSFEEYLKISKEKRPERRALAEAVSAKRSLYEVQKTQYFPMVVVGAKGEFAEASVREHQTSPFANDAANKLDGVIGVGIRWNLGFKERASEVSKARAEWMEAEARLRYLDAGMNVELYKAFHDLSLAKQAYELRGESTRATKRLVQDMAFDDVISKAKTSSKVDSSTVQKFAAYLTARRDEIDAIYKFNIQTYKFEQLLGASLL